MKETGKAQGRTKETRKAQGEDEGNKESTSGR